RAVQDLGAAREEVELLRERCRALGERVGEEEARCSALETRLEHAKNEARLEQTKNDPELGALRERLRAAEERIRGWEGAARAAAGEREGEVSKLETQLRERGREIQELRAEVERREKLVRELVMTNFPARPDAASHVAVSE